MSDVMLIGVLRFPVSLWRDDDPLDKIQRHSRYIQAADRIESDGKIIDELRQQLAEMTAAMSSIANNTCCGDCQEAKRVAISALQKIATLQVSINGNTVNAQEYMRDIAIKALEDTK